MVSSREVSSSTANDEDVLSNHQQLVINISSLIFISMMVSDVQYRGFAMVLTWFLFLAVFYDGLAMIKKS